jgi:hypothetical protein
MKKFICVLVFLAMVNVANAGIVDLVISSLNGQPIAPVKEITIKQTDIINMDIIYTPTPGSTLFGLSVDIFADNRQVGTLNASEPTWPTGVWDMNPPMSGTQANPDGSVGVWASAAAAGLTGGIAVDHILFHCDAPGNVVLLMMRPNENLPPGYTIELDSAGNPVSIGGYGAGVIVHQLIPEPMTLTLLGLGGLFLARRKR